MTTQIISGAVRDAAGGVASWQVTVTASAPVVSSWQDLKIGGGGYMTGMDIHADGTLAARVDVFGAYVGSTTVGTAWRQTATQAGMPAAYSNNHPYASGGVYEIRIAPSNSSIIYKMYGISGRSLTTVLKSVDKGVNWTATGFTPDNSDPNDGSREFRGQNMAIDPANSDVVYVGSQTGALRVTFDGGTTWATVSGVPTSNGNGICAIVFDTSSGITGGKTNRLIVGSNGHGLYVCANAGSGSPTWSLISGSPANPGHAKIGIDGTYYCNTLDQAKIFRLTTANVLTEITPDGQGCATIVCDLVSADKLISVRPGGYFNASVNCRAATPTWTGTNFTHSVVAADCPWLQESQDIFLSDGEAWMDPAVPNRIWFAMGTTVLYTDNVYAVTAAGTNQAWHSQTAGIENLVANQVIVPPGGVPILCNWDRPFWRIADPTNYQSGYGPGYDTQIRLGASVAYATSDANFIVGLTTESQNGDDTYGYSTDGGESWSKFATIPAGYGGCIAATDTERIVIARSNNGQVYQTQNRGGLWTSPPTLPNNSGYGSSANNNAKPLCADRVTLGTFYLYDYNAPGVHRSTDGGITWSLVFSGHISSNDSFELQLEAVPGNAGHLYFTAGPGSDLGDYTSLTTLAASFPSNVSFNKSTNGGAAWSAISGVTDVICFGFGAPKPGGGGYPALFIVGWVGGVYSIWRSDDAQNSTPTWTNLGAWPRGWSDLPKCISGNPNLYGECYVGFQGSSYAYRIGA
jgi:BNR/Asp-box repeat